MNMMNKCEWEFIENNFINSYFLTECNNTYISIEYPDNGECPFCKNKIKGLYE